MRLDRSIKVEVSTVTSDADFGSPTESWSTYTQVFAHLEIMGGNEDYQAERKTGLVRAVFTVRHNAITELIGTRHRIIFNNQVWDIRSAVEDTTKARRQYIRIEAEQKGSDHGGI